MHLCHAHHCILIPALLRRRRHGCGCLAPRVATGGLAAAALGGGWPGCRGCGPAPFGRGARPGRRGAVRGLREVAGHRESVAGAGARRWRCPRTLQAPTLRSRGMPRPADSRRQSQSAVPVRLLLPVAPIGGGSVGGIEDERRRLSKLNQSPLHGAHLPAPAEAGSICETLSPVRSWRLIKLQQGHFGRSAAMLRTAAASRLACRAGRAPGRRGMASEAPQQQPGAPLGAVLMGAAAAAAAAAWLPAAARPTPSTPHNAMPSSNPRLGQPCPPSPIAGLNPDEPPPPPPNVFAAVGAMGAGGALSHGFTFTRFRARHG